MITNTIADFRREPAIQNRPRRIVSATCRPDGIRLILDVKGRQAALRYTHETSLYLYEDAEPTASRLYLQIRFWTESIFRVTFSLQEGFVDRYGGLPVDGRMLIGTPEAVTCTCRETDDAFVLETSAMRVLVDKQTARITASFADGTVCYRQLRSEFVAADIHDLSVAELNGDYACFEAVELANDETIYGLGGRFDSVTRNGRCVDFHNKDAVGTTSGRSYINVPFYLSTKGYGLFLNSAAPTDWQIGTADLGALQFAVQDSQLDYFVIPGKDPKLILRGYCSLTGFSKLPPLWSFGLWMSRNSYLTWEVAEEVGRQIRAHDIPCDVLHLDSAWFKRDLDCDLKFSTERFPNPEEHLARLRQDGFRVSLWQYNFIPPSADNEHYQEAVANGYLATDGDGKPYCLPDTCKGSWIDDVTVDFSNPDARKWYGDKIERLIRMGASAIKTDFGEGIPEEAVYQNIEGKHFHNLYPLIYNNVVFNATKSASGEGVVWARSGTAGSQRFPLHWGGDSQSTFEALTGILRAALSAGMSGIPFFSHDIGGFIGTPTDELYVRWSQLGLFSSHSRCHGAGNENYREPWRFSKTACDVFRYYDKLRYALMPYIYEQARKCTETGLPMMRALYLEFPNDRNVRSIDDQYMFGDGLLIAPVLKPLSQTDIREIYLPQGVWFDYFTKERIESHGMWIRRKVDLQTMPIYVKEGITLQYCAEQSHLQNGLAHIVKTEEYR